MKKKKILTIHMVRAPYGCERMIHHLLTNLDPDKYEPHLLTLEKPGWPADDYINLYSGSQVKIMRRVLKSNYDLKTWWWLIRWIKKQEFSIVHTHLMPADIIGIVSAKLAGVPSLVSTKHGMEFYKTARWHTKLLLRRSSRWLLAFICITQYMKQEFQKVFKLPDAKMPVIPHGIPAPGGIKEKSSKDNPVVLFVGRMLEFKGVESLVRIWREIYQKVPQARLLMIGDGPLREDLENEVKEKEYGESVTFTGEVKDVGSYYQEGSILVLPSTTEGLPVILLEAMSFGLPIITYKIMGIPEVVVHEKTGLLIPPGSEEKFKQAMLSLLQEPEKARAMGGEGLKRFNEKYSLKRWIQDMESLYDSIST